MLAMFPSEARSRAAAAMAPANCALQYATARGQGKCRVSAKAKVTAALKWAPLMWPTA